jgi:hypothetical protein
MREGEQLNREEEKLSAKQAMKEITRKEKRKNKSRGRK